MVIKKILLTILAFMIAFVAIILVNIFGAVLLEMWLPNSFGVDSLPLTVTAQSLYLVMGFIAGAAGAFFVVLMVPEKPVLYAVIYTIMILGIDILVVVTLWGTLPAWVLASIVLIVPPQAFAGALAGHWVRQKWKIVKPNQSPRKLVS